MGVDGDVDSVLAGVVHEGVGVDWWADKAVWTKAREQVEQSGGGVDELALVYSAGYLAKWGKAVEKRFGEKYGNVFDPDRAGGYQPMGAVGGGVAEVETLYWLKGIRKASDLLSVEQAVESEYGMSPEIRQLIEATNIDECRGVLRTIDPTWEIVEVDEVEEKSGPDSECRGWAALGTISVKRGSFEEEHPTIVHEVSHVYMKKLYDSLGIIYSSGMSEDEFAQMSRVNKALTLISDEDIARLNEIRTRLKYFEKSKDGRQLGQIVDAVKHYNWHCFGKVALESD